MSKPVRGENGSVAPSWGEHVSIIENVLKNHFPEAADDIIREEAESVFGAWDVGTAWQKMAEDARRRPEKDIEGIKTAANDLRKAAKRLGETGMHGEVELQPIAGLLRLLGLDANENDLQKKERTGDLLQADRELIASRLRCTPDRHLPGIPQTEVGDVVADFLFRFALELHKAAERIEKGADNYLAEVSGEKGYPKGGRKLESAAVGLASALAETFGKLAGKAPKISVSHHYGDTAKRSGRYLRLVEECFEELGIAASAPEACQKALTHHNGETSEKY